MKRKILILIVLLISISVYSQSKKDLLLKIDSLNSVINNLTNDCTLLKNENAALKSAFQQVELIINSTKLKSDSSIVTEQDQTNKTSEVKRCKAITQSGNQCSRMAEAGSDYCWQHKNKQSNNQNTQTSTPSKNTTSYDSGSRTIQTGPRGGQYYINSNGKKTYIKHK
jgi:hypothetical protein